VGGFPSSQCVAEFRRLLLAGEKLLWIGVGQVTRGLGEANFHIEFRPKYRRDVFRESEAKKLGGKFP